MEYIIIIILFIIVLLLTTYLLMLKRDLNRISKEIEDYKESNSNNLIHSKIPSSETSVLIKHINNLLDDIKKQRIYFEHKNVELEKMLMNIAHDLRTPLTSALGYMDIILSSDLSKEEQIYELKIIGDKLKRLEQLINAFFEFSQVAINGKDVELQKVNLVEILEECILHYYDDYQKQDRKIILDNDSMKYYFLSNKNMLIRIFDNLIINAFKHGFGNLQITLNTNDNLRIVFKNKVLNESLDLEHIFDEFYTTDISRTKGNTGLGLAIVKKYTKILDGKISAYKEKENLSIIIDFKKR